jgi:ethanolamine utilization protein EutP (predicted NTPase)
MATTKHFDAFIYIKKAKELGTSEELAEFQARQIEYAIEVAIAAIQAKDLATKADISMVRAELREAGLRLQSSLKSLEMKLMTVYVSGFFMLLGILAQGFHWF